MECSICGSHLALRVLHSNAGWYIGRCCDQCGPYSRDSMYYPTKDIARLKLLAGNYGEYDD